MLILLNLLRIKHWIKNFLVFFPLFFAGKFFCIEKLISTIIAFFCFSLISSSGYIINDIVDINLDKKHTKKKNRPIAKGKISKKTGLLISFILFFFAILISYYCLGKFFLILLISYYLNSILYSIYLKRIPYLDIIIISNGFILRLLGGGIAANIKVSFWLVIITFFVSIMLGLGKRYEEIIQENYTRINISLYNKSILKKTLILTGSISVLFFGYYLYAKQKFSIILFLISIILIANYIYSVLNKNIGEPTEFFLTNKLNFIFLVIWFFIFLKLIYY